MSGGWIKLWRSLLDSAEWQMCSPPQKVAIVGLLLQVNHAPSEMGCRVCKRVISVPAGATAKAARTLADGCGVSSGVMKRTLRILTATGFVSSQGRPRCHSLYVVKNWKKYQGSDCDCDPVIDLDTDLVTPPVMYPPAAREEEGRSKKEETTTGDLFPRPAKATPAPPPDSALATAEHLRSALLAAGAKGYGWRSAASWTRKRAGWARVLNGAAMEQGIGQEQIRELASWALAAPGWEVDGEAWSWLRVLDVADPGAKLAGKLAAIRSSRERAESKRAVRLETYSPGPGAPVVAYLADGEVVSHEEYARLKSAQRGAH